MEGVVFLLSAGADRAKQNHQGFDALMLACAPPFIHWLLTALTSSALEN